MIGCLLAPRMRAAKERLQHGVRLGPVLRDAGVAGLGGVEDERDVLAAEAVLGAVGVERDALIAQQLAARDRVDERRARDEVRCELRRTTHEGLELRSSERPGHPDQRTRGATS